MDGVLQVLATRRGKPGQERSTTVADYELSAGSVPLFLGMTLCCVSRTLGRLIEMTCLSNRLQAKVPAHYTNDEASPVAG